MVTTILLAEIQKETIGLAIILTDNATYMAQNLLLRTFCEQRGIRQVFSPPYSQYLNGKAEHSLIIFQDYYIICDLSKFYKQKVNLYLVAEKLSAVHTEIHSRPDLIYN